MMRFHHLTIFAAQKLNSSTGKRMPVVLGLWLCLCIVAHGQITDAYGAHAVPRPDIGHDYIHGLNETVNPANGSVNISIDIPLPPGRDLTLPFSFSYNSGSVFTYHDSGQGDVGLYPDVGIDGYSHAGWAYSTPMLTYSLNHSQYDQNVYPAIGPLECFWTTNYMFTEPTGARHPLGLAGAVTYGENESGLCPRAYGFKTGGDFKTVAHLSCWTGQPETCTPNQVATVDGTVYTFDTNGASNYSMATSVQDRNHNMVNISAGPFRTTYTDELGRTALSFTAYMGAGLNGNALPTVDTITVPQYSAPYSVQWSSQRISGSYGHSKFIGPDTGGQGICSLLAPSITGGWTATAVDLVSRVTLPNGTYYQFTYDSVFGLIKRITYPNGGYVEYDWAMQQYFDQGAYSVDLGGPTNQYLFFGGPAYDPLNDPPPLPAYVNCMYAYDWPAVVARRVSFDGTTIAQSQTFSYSASPLSSSGGSRTTTVHTTTSAAADVANAVPTGTSTTLYNYNINQSASNDPLNFVPSYGQLLYTAVYGGTYITQIISSQPLMPANNPLESSIVYQDGGGNVLKTVSKTWFNAPSDIENSETVTLGANGPSSTTAYQHAWPGQTLQTAVTNYDNSQLVTNVAYHTFCPYLGTSDLGQCIATGQAIFDLPDSVTVATSTLPNSPPIAETDYTGYDANGPNGTNGNVHAITKQCVYYGTACAAESTTFGYDSNGQTTSVTDGRGHTTTYDYTDNYTSSAPPSSHTGAYPTRITYPTVNGVTQVQQFAYDYSSGHLNWALDANQQRTSYVYSDSFGNPDPFGRLRETDYPDGGKTTVTYNDSGSSPSVSVSQRDGGTSVSVRDGMGHVVQSQQLGPTASQTAYVDTVYDGTGHVASVSNPYFPGSSPSDGITSFSYDALGRKLYQCQPDNTGSSIPCQPRNSYLAWTYSGNVTTSTDEMRHPWTRTSDAFGRLTQVTEPSGAQTAYSYDPLGNIGTVTQSGVFGDVARTRGFTYDSLSRLVTSTNPETGTICYGVGGVNAGGSGPPPCLEGYDGNGNLLAKTDGNGNSISYTYDALNRLTAKNGPGIAEGFSYDSATVGNFAAAYPIGRLVQHTNPAGGTSTQYSYDTMGRVVLQGNTLPNGCCNPMANSLQASYDYAGNLKTLTYPDGRVLSHAYDSAGRLIAMGDGGSTQNYLQGVLYGASGSPISTTLGNGLLQQVTLNNREQIQSMVVTDPLGGTSQTMLSHTYCYAAMLPSDPLHCPTGGAANNGNIWGIADTLNPARTQGFTYDALNRISSFSLAGVSNQQYQIDSFGNMSPLTFQNTQSGSIAVATYGFDAATNRINNLPCAAPVQMPYPYPYDAGGNLLCSSDQYGGVVQNTYDAENRIVAMNTLNATPFVTYTYGADGNRVRKTFADGTWTEYVYFNGQPIAEKDAASNWTDYIYANGKKIVRVGASGGAAHFHATTPQAWTNCDERLQPVQPYPVKQGDMLSWREYKVNTIGGINVWFQNAGGIQWASNTTDGATLNQDRTDDQWLSRTLNLSRWVGDTILQYSVAKDTTSTSPNPWDIWVGDMAITSADGTVTQVIGNGGGATVLGGGCQGPSSGMVAEFQAQATAPNAAAGLGTHFFLDDHLGSAQMEFSSGGWPVWQGQFAPYGQEIQNGSLLQPDQADGSSNHYKFTGKERDQESGLHYFGARYYAGNMGRFMSPDWSAEPVPIPYADRENPQTLNLYSYVSNNPLSRSDPNGHQVDPCAGDPNCVTVVADPLSADPVHHYFPQSLFKNASQYARDAFRNWTTNPLKNLGMHKGYSGPHRAYNAKVKEIIQKVSEKYGKQIAEWGETEVNAAVAEIKAEAGKAGGEISTLIDDLEKINPNATNTIKNIGNALAEVEASPGVQTVEQDINTFCHEVPCVP